MKITINPKYRAVTDFINSVPQVFDSGGTVIKNDRNVLKIFDTPAGRMVVKKFHRPNIFQKAFYSVTRRSKARKAYDFAAEFNARGIPSPEGVACIEDFRGGILADCYFISVESNMKEVYGLLHSPGHGDPALRRAIAGMMAKMHTTGIVQGDPNLRNFLCAKDKDGKWQLEVIDTNRSRTYPAEVAYNDCVDNLRRLSHDRELLALLLRDYAEIRRMDAGPLIKDVFRRLSDFEHNRAVRHRLKELAGLKKKRT